jgi:hypothetical protein
MAWATNATAAITTTASVSVVGVSTGLVDFAFAPADLNHAAGRSMSEVGVSTTAGVSRVYRQGTFLIAGSPYAGGAAVVNWQTNVNWGTINWVGLPAYASTASVTNEAALRAAGDAANVSALAGYSNHVRALYLRGVEVEAGVWQIYIGD